MSHTDFISISLLSFSIRRFTPRRDSMFILSFLFDQTGRFGGQRLG
jgi:hypothetical protein